MPLPQWVRSEWAAFADTGNPGLPECDTEQGCTPGRNHLHIWADHVFNSLPLRPA
ncbi:hypothetical protein [Streptomyces hokutonensis]|uniref:hypothetical protein n=1 Tax=Streptomyces hokutonensis TaxID=1306990 RepID=UPI00369B19B4